MGVGGSVSVVFQEYLSFFWQQMTDPVLGGFQVFLGLVYFWIAFIPTVESVPLRMSAECLEYSQAF